VTQDDPTDGVGMASSPLTTIAAGVMAVIVGPRPFA
jgi:hypothetical protein